MAQLALLGEKHVSFYLRVNSSNLMDPILLVHIYLCFLIKHISRLLQLLSFAKKSCLAHLSILINKRKIDITIVHTNSTKQGGIWIINVPL